MEMTVMGSHAKSPSPSASGASDEATGFIEGRSTTAQEPGESNGDEFVMVDRPVSKFTKWRNIIGFWIFGLANNYPYVVMLSAAFDIIHNISHSGDSGNKNGNESNDTIFYSSCTSVNGSYEERELCEKAGTSVILLADIIPTFFIKLIAPYVMNFIPYWIRVVGAVLFSLASFLLVALGNHTGVIIFGVVCASISSGFGEVTFLSLTARYDKSTVSAWSSGTGAAGVAGALVYTVLTFAISPDVTLMIQVFVPVIMLLTYFFILGKPGTILPSATPTLTSVRDVVQSNGSNADGDRTANDDLKPLLNEAASEEDSTNGRWKCTKSKLRFFNKEETAFWWSHVKYIPRLWKYMLPLFLVYVAEYMINQGFFELLYNENTHIGSLCIDQDAQYRILQTMYQIGVLISRSSVSVFHFKWFWILSVLQVVNVAFFFCAAIYLFLPSFWLTIFIVLYEGLLGGGVYVNAFYSISKQVPKVHREFSMGVASVADSTGIMVAAFLAQALHYFICSRYIGFKPSSSFI